MNKSSPLLALGFVFTFLAGFGTHFLYKRWNVPGGELTTANILQPAGSPQQRIEPQSHSVTFLPQEPGTFREAELPLLQAREVEKLRAQNGHRARIRGRVFRVGHAVKSNTYFIDFGPAREALKAVIFASALDSFKERELAPTELEGKEVEIEGSVRDHPQYGLEIILEHPEQIKILK
jgi:hypothetical protein